MEEGGEAASANAEESVAVSSSPATLPTSSVFSASGSIVKPFHPPLNFDDISQTKRAEQMTRLMTLSLQVPSGHILHQWLYSKMHPHATTVASAGAKSDFANPLFSNDEWSCGEHDTAATYSKYADMIKAHPEIKQMDFALAIVLQSSVTGQLAAEAFGQVAAPTFSQYLYALFLKTKQEDVQVNISLLHRMANVIHGIDSEDYAQEVTELLRLLTSARLGITELMVYIYVMRLQQNNEMTASRARDFLRKHAVTPHEDFSLLRMIRDYPDDRVGLNPLSINSTQLQIKHGGGRVGGQAETCKRCLHTGHSAATCYAVMSKNGTRLTTPGKPVPTDVAARRKRQNESRRGANTQALVVDTVSVPQPPPAIVPANIALTPTSSTLLPHQLTMQAQAAQAYARFQQTMANINCIAVIASDHVESSTMSLTSSIEPSSVDALSRDFAEVAKQLISFDAEINTGVGGVPRHKQPARVILDSGAGIDFTTAHHERNSDAVVTHPNRSVTVQGIGGQTTSTAGQGTWTFNVQDVNGQSQPLIRSEAQIRTSLPGSMPFDTRVISAGAMVKQENCKMVLNFPDEMYLETASGIRYALEINDQNIVVFVAGDPTPTAQTSTRSTLASIHFVDITQALAPASVTTETVYHVMTASSPLADAVLTHHQKEQTYMMVTQTMHLRTAHSSLISMRHTLEQRTGDTFNGVPIRASHLIKRSCNSCLVSKSRQAPLSKKPPTQVRSNAPLFTFDSLGTAASTTVDDIDRHIFLAFEAEHPGTFVHEEDVHKLMRTPSLLKPGQVVSLDPKSFRFSVVGKAKAMLHAMDVHTNRLYACVYSNQKQYGEAFLNLIAEWQLHRKPYPVTVLFDGGGGNRMLEKICAQFGINWDYTPPNLQSLNPVEHTIKQLYDAVNATMIDNAGLIPLRYYSHVIMNTIQLMNMRSSSSNYDYQIPLQLWNPFHQVDVKYLRNIGDIVVTRKTPAQRGSEFERLARTFKVDAAGNIVNAYTYNPNARGETTIVLGHPDAYRQKTVMVLRLNNRGNFSTSTQRAPQPTDMTVVARTPAPLVDMVADADVSLGSTGPDVVLPAPNTVDTDAVLSDQLSAPGEVPAAANVDSADVDATDAAADRSFASDSTHLPDDVDDLTDIGVPDNHDDVTIEQDFYDFNTDSTVTSIMSANHVSTLYNILKAKHTCDSVFDELTSHEAKQIELVNTVYTESQVDSDNDTMAYVNFGTPRLMKPSMDVPWRRIVDSSQHQEFEVALAKELSRLEQYGFYIIPSDDPQYDQLLRNSNEGRLLASRKRDGTAKVRCVELGDRSPILRDVNSYAPVATLDHLRQVFLSPNLPRPSSMTEATTGEHIVAMMDNNSAYLQSDPLPIEKQYAVRVYNPLTKEVFLMHCPTHLYGSIPGAASWFRSAIAQAHKDGWQQGFKPGSKAATLSQDHFNALSMSAANAPCVLYHPQTNTLKVLYVDDCCYSGYQKLVESHYKDWRKRFDTTPLQILREGEPMDFIGICLSISNGMKCMDMQYYIVKIAQVFKVLDYPTQRLPMAFQATDLRPLDADAAAEFRAVVGANGWVVLAVFLTSKTAQSYIASHLSKPSVGAFELARNLAAYHFQHRQLGLGAPLVEPNPVEPLYTFFSDSNNGEQVDDYKCRRGFVAGVNYSPQALALTDNRAKSFVPMTAYSKTSGIAKATTLFADTHSGTGSGENETYALGDAATHAMHFSYCIEEAGRSFVYPIELFTDATTARTFANGTKGTTRMRQIDMRQEWISSLRDTRIITVKYVPSKMTGDGKCNLSDCFTKLFGKHPLIFERQRDLLQVEVDEHSLFNTDDLTPA